MKLSNRELFYVIHVTTSIVIGAILRLFGLKYGLKYVLSFIGILQILLFCGTDAVYFFIMVAISILLITNDKIKNPKIIFIFCFGYRVWFSCAWFLGLPMGNDNLANALMLVGTLKIILVAYEVYDYREKSNKKSLGDNYRTFGALILEEEPTYVDLFCYMTTCYGLFTGPIFKYRTYMDMLSTPYEPVTKIFKQQVQQFVFTLCIFCVGKTYLRWDYFKSPKLQSDPFILRYLHIFPIGILVHMQFMVIWMAAECSFILIGLGMYPANSHPWPGKGPTEIPTNQSRKSKPEWDFTTIKNTTLKCITEPSTWKTLRIWNGCVQWWFSQFIYQSSVLSKHNKFWRAMATLFMSALWHGTKPGYFLSYSFGAYAAVIERWCLPFQTQCLQGKFATRLYSLLNWILVKSPIADSFMICHVLLDHKLIWNFFVSTYFVSFVSPAIMLLLCEGCRLTFNAFGKAKRD